MSHTKKPLAARVAAGTGAVALALFAVLAGATSASATPSPDETAPIVSAPNIDTNALGSITIHKFAEPDDATELPHNGTAIDAEKLKGLDALEGVGFSLRKVTSIDLSKNAGWTATEGLTAQAVLDDDAKYPLGTAAVGVTDEFGDLPFTKLPLGVYLVTETDPGENAIATEIAPFLVSVPLPLDNTWLYDVHVYPKNSLTAVTKDVDDTKAHGLGDEVVWTVSATVPQLAKGATLDSFGIVDDLDDRLGYAGATVALDPASAGTLVEDDDYVISEVDGLVSVSFTAAGLDKLEAAQGAQVSVAITTTVDTLGDGIIKNSAKLYVNDEKNTFNSNTVDTKWGALVIHKYAAENEKLSLQGAQFQIFTSEDDAKAQKNPVTVDGEKTFTSNEKGIAAIPGLKAGDYWLVETQAPVGYTAVTTPLAVTVTAGDVSLTSIDYKIKNSQTLPFMLPLTGGNGTLAFMLGGLALLAVAVGVGIRQRSVRRSKTV